MADKKIELKATNGDVRMKVAEGAYLHAQALVDSGDWEFVHKADADAAVKAAKAAAKANDGDSTQ